MTTLPFHPDDLPGTTPEQAAHQSGRGTPRLRIPHRDQVEMSWASLDERLDPDSQARVVWSLVCRLDLDAWLKDIKAIERHAGRDATDPRLLVALWVFATLKGIGSAGSWNDSARTTSPISGFAAGFRSIITCSPLSDRGAVTSGTSCSRKSSPR